MTLPRRATVFVSLLFRPPRMVRRRVGKEQTHADKEDGRLKMVLPPVGSVANVKN